MLNEIIMLIRQPGGQNSQIDLNLQERCHQKKKGIQLMAHHLKATVPKRMDRFVKGEKKTKRNNYITQEINRRKKILTYLK
jgi:hypothetical protein